MIELFYQNPVAEEKIQNKNRMFYVVIDYYRYSRLCEEQGS